MSLTQIEEKISKLSPGELDHLLLAIQARRDAKRALATPEMLAERRRLMAEVLSGEWSADLPDWQETREREKQKSEGR